LSVHRKTRSHDDQACLCTAQKSSKQLLPFAASLSGFALTARLVRAFHRSGSYMVGLRKKFNLWVNFLAGKREEPIEGSDGR
jgi:hypothetical protein